MPSTILALTSLSPDARKIRRQQICIASWIAAGLKVVSFNHPIEIRQLQSKYAIDFIPVEETSKSVFGRHFIPVYAILDWARHMGLPAMLINADIQLNMTSNELRRIQRLSHGGLCYFVRYNHQPYSKHHWREPFGIDAFLLHGGDVDLFTPSFLSVGQPFWDYWIPHAFAAAQRSIFSVEFPAAYHECHQQAWSWADWHRCALEFDRITQMLSGDKSLQACHFMSCRVREDFDKAKKTIDPRPFQIRQWVEETFGNSTPKIFLELGAHDGEDTAWMASLPGTTIYAFEPDPRNNPRDFNNVFLSRAAIGERDGRCPFILSKTGWGREWTYSSSIKPPKNHLSRYPVAFGESIEVPVITLDSFCRQRGFSQVDFIWADIQGAEGEMIRGGPETLSRTRFLYTEYSDDELYEGQISLDEILRLLPDFRIIEIWPDEVLLQNRKLTR